MTAAIMILVAGASSPINFISVEDVAKFIIIALEDTKLCGQTLTIGGPQNLTFDESKARLLKVRHELATSNWQVDMSEVVKHHPVNLVSLDR